MQRRTENAFVAAVIVVGVATPLFYMMFSNHQADYPAAWFSTLGIELLIVFLMWNSVRKYRRGDYDRYRRP